MNTIQDPRSTPPIEPIESAGRKPSWPSVIGVLCVIYAILGIVANTCNGISPWLQNSVMGMIGITGPEIPLSIKIMSLVGGLLGLILGIMLFIGAFGLLRNKQSGYRLVMTWVVLRVILAVIGIGFAMATVNDSVKYQMSIQDATNDMIKSGNSRVVSVPVNTEDELRRNTWMIILLMGAAVFVFPIIIGVLLSNRVRREYVSTWGMEAA